MDNLSRKKFKRKKSAAFFYKEEIGKLLTDANNDFVHGRSEESITKLKKVIQSAPTCHQAYFSIGLIHEENNEFVKAYECFKISLSLKKTDSSLLQKLYFYSKDLNRKEDTLYFLEKLQDKSKLDEMLELAVSLNLTEKVHEILIEKNDSFTNEFISNLNVKNLKKVITKIFTQFTEDYLSKKMDSSFFDQIIEKLYQNQEYNFLFKIYAKLCSSELSLKNHLIFLISLHHTNSYLFHNNSKVFKNFPFDPLLEGLYFELGEFDNDALEFLSNTVDLNIKKTSLKKLAEKSETCTNHEEGHKCNLYYYLKYLECDPYDNQVRLIVSSIYKEQGQNEFAKKYTDLSSFSFKSLESTVQFFKEVKDKRKMRFSNKDCNEMRKIYDQTVLMRYNFANLSKEELDSYFSINCQLLNDFFTNLYIFPSKIGSFKNFMAKNERNEDTNEIIYQSLHGLHPHEWLDVVKMNFHVSIQSYDLNAFKIAYRSLDASIFKETEHFYDLFYLIIKYCVFHNNLEILSKTIRKLFHVNETFFYLYHFLLNYFIDYPNNIEFRRVYINLRRIYFRNFQKEGIIKDDFLFLSSYVPCFLYPGTLDKIDRIYQKKKLKPAETILLSIIYFNNSRSRKIINRNYFIQKGFNLLKSIKNEIDEGLYHYNLGRAYQHFGLNGFAEMNYKRCFNTKFEMYAKFNLILIYKKNGSFDLIRELLHRDK